MTPQFTQGEVEQVATDMDLKISPDQAAHILTLLDDNSNWELVEQYVIFEATQYGH